MAPPPNQTSFKTRPVAPAAAGLVAIILVFLVLPNPLKVPQNNPTASAEYAPVPGRSDQNASGANFGETGLANSAGVGAGGNGIGALPGTPPIPPPPQFIPPTRECVGNPPRQTEDPLSPPCVPGFKGDNGGATAQGVTASSIDIVLYNDFNMKGDMNTPYASSQETNSTGTNAYEYINLVRTVKAQLHYFQARFETYGRTVHLIGQASTNSTNTTCPQREQDAADTTDEFHPFAAVQFGDAAECYTSALAKHNTPSFGLSYDIQRKWYQQYPGLVWGFMPDQETEIGWSASFICQKLKGGTAKFTSDPLLKGNKRKFGFIEPENSQRGPGLQEESDLLIKDLHDQCNMTFDDIKPYDASGAGAGGQEAPGIMQEFKQKGITTIVCYCIPVPTEQTVGTMQNAATGVAYQPEWYWDDASAMDRGIWESTYGSKNQQSFGTSYLWRAQAFQDQYHYQAFKSVDPDGQPNGRFDFNIYHLFLNLFEAIQAAGPNLTVDTVKQGMYTFNYINQSNPWVPTGGYGPYNSHAVGDYTFVDTAMGWWWDPTGTAPGGNKNSGCIRTMDGGQRYYAGHWPKGDSDLFVNANGPCSQDLQKLADPGSSTTV